MSEIRPLSRAEAQAARDAAARGETLPLETLRRFVATIRKNWTSKPEEQTKGKSRTKAKPVDESQITFF